MRSALSITLVLLAAISGHAASAAELAAAQHPLRLFTSAAYSEAAEQSESAEAGQAVNSSRVARAHLSASSFSATASAISADPKSRSYEAAVVRAIPAHGP
jgi:hypothetical protein